MSERPNLRLVAEPAEEESLGTLMIRNTVNLVVARAAIRQCRSMLLLNARVCRTIGSEIDAEFSDPADRLMAASVMHGKQLAYREAARMLRGKDK